jgi:hypothetical protein
MGAVPTETAPIFLWINGRLIQAALTSRLINPALRLPACASDRSTRARCPSPLVADTLDAATVPAGSDAFYITHGCGVYLSPQISGVAAGDGDVFVLGRGDLWAWSSPLVSFSERAGPAMIDLSIFGYFATKVIDPRGVSSIRHT